MSVSQNDTLQRFLFEHANIRGEIAHLNQTYRDIIQQHPYPKPIRQLLGEVLVSTLLIAGSMKFEGEVCLQFQGDHRLPLLIAQCTHELEARAFAKYAQESEGSDFEQAFLQGKMVLTIQQHKSSKAYQSIIPIASTSISDNMMHYFAQSEQVSTKLWLAVDEKQAAGMILQLMPGQDSQKQEEFWEYAVHIGQTITQQELLGLDNATILHRLYHETELRLFDTRATRFQCRCHPDKMKQVLQVLGEAEAKALLEEKGQVEIRCDFCNQLYTFDAIDITMLFHQ